MTEEAIDLICQVISHHHPYGPSKLENYDPRSGGCAAFIPNPESNEKAEYGSLKHKALAEQDLRFLEGDSKSGE